ncbi:D-alanyl-D-alanine carboxypeptidase/D-alanyl-D-alanine-endopeptidase [Aureliella helgolandensis]|uniref:D-alanyl-D-alanine carboxypeptidase n=1 Tax=Aureliella helgolandensis TaxID=2527968 RepID=A0A518GDD9_9BACT|nr:D-alanyl-D-alanine carboxypeptidase [Aureliella helgolandensis]QDV26577.1 D-alanyl-D-alanine carboxypeptidase precursor [Aureliella helgolandensis]
MRTIGPLLCAMWSFMLLVGCNHESKDRRAVPADIQAIFDRELYRESVWALRVVDLDSGEVLYDQNSEDSLFIGSVRKVFTIGETLEALGPEFRFRTPVHRRGIVRDDGVLEGDLILVAKGDFTMGGRRSPDGTMAITNLDHNEANTLGNAILTSPNPLWGFDSLAAQVAGSGIKAVNGEVVIDDRLFQPFEFREEFMVSPIFVNDDLIDLVIRPTRPGKLAEVEHRPLSQAFTVTSELTTALPGEGERVELAPNLADGLGAGGSSGAVAGRLPADFVPPITESWPWVRTFRITEPANYARTVFIEALQRAGVKIVNAQAVGSNRSDLLPPRDTYTAETLQAELESLPFAEYAKFVLKVSYNIGSDTSLMLWGLTQGCDNLEDALALEREHLVGKIGIPESEFHFVDGSGGGPTTATNTAVLQMLKYNAESSFFPQFLDSLPVLGGDGPLAFFTDFESDPTLAGAKGNAYAKTGTFAIGSKDGILLKGQSLAGFIDTQHGRRLMYSLTVNNVQLSNDVQELLKVSQDQSTITAILWRDH